MTISATLRPDRTFHKLSGTSKKRVFEQASELIAETVDSLDAEQIFTALINRERLGSTGLGEGVAIPHCRLEGSTESIGALISLDEAIDYEAPDGKAVDLLYVLMVPSEATDAHLKTLAELAGLFSQAEFREALRAAKSSDELYQIALNYQS